MMKTRRIPLHVFLVILLTVAAATVWTTRSHANSHRITAIDEAPMVFYDGEQPNSGEPDGGDIRPPVKPIGTSVNHEGCSLVRSELFQMTWDYWRAVIGRFAL